MSKKEKFIEYMLENGKTHTWGELADMFKLAQHRDNGGKSDYVRQIWKRYTKSHKLENFVDNARITKVKRWQDGNGDWKESIHYAESFEDISQLTKLKEQLVKELKEISVKDVLTHKKKKIDPIAYEISLPDFHFGKITGESIEEQKAIFIEAVRTLLNKANGLNIDRFILPIGNDLLNSEGLRMATTKGTPQHDNAEWMITFKVAVKAIIEAVEILKQEAPVDIIMVSGNHDYERCFYLGEVLDAYYSMSNSVTVDNSEDSRKYYTYGVNLIGYTHGDSEKHNELPLIMATEVPMQFAQAEHREWHLGHLHKHTVDEYRGVSVKILPALCGNDSWHKKMGYSSPRRAQAYIWSKTRGCEGYIQYNKQ
jgi:hypothetical protein